MEAAPGQSAASVRSLVRSIRNRWTKLTTVPTADKAELLTMVRGGVVPDPGLPIVGEYGEALGWQVFIPDYQVWEN